MLVIFSIVASVFLGGLVGTLIAWRFEKKASEELRFEAQELRRLTLLVLRALEEGGIATLTRDERGTICGFVLGGSARLEATSSLDASGEVIRPSPPTLKIT